MFGDDSEKNDEEREKQKGKTETYRIQQKSDKKNETKINKIPSVVG